MSCVCCPQEFNHCRNRDDKLDIASLHFSIIHALVSITWQFIYGVFPLFAPANIRYQITPGTFRDMKAKSNAR